MDPAEYRTIYQVEERHWWYVGMQRITTSLLARHYADRDDLQILDAGCGTGAAMTHLAAFGRVTGCDLSPIALSFCQKRSLARLGQASVTRLPFASATFDLVVSHDVLYHRAVDDVDAALLEFRRVLRPAGRLLLRLPAYERLRGRHDKVVHTARRFSKSRLRPALEAAGFAVEKLTYANALLFPLAVAKRLSERVIPPSGDGSDIGESGGWQDIILSQFLFAEARWLAKGGFPFGLSVIALARKSEDLPQ